MEVFITESMSFLSYSSISLNLGNTTDPHMIYDCLVVTELLGRKYDRKWVKGEGKTKDHTGKAHKVLICNIITIL